MIYERKLICIFIVIISVYDVFCFRTQSAGVRGVLMCGKKPLSDSKVNKLFLK